MRTSISLLLDYLSYSGINVSILLYLVVEYFSLDMIFLDI